MKVALAAYKLLLEVAEAHRGMSPQEIRFLKRYRSALGLSREQILSQTATPITERMIEGSPKEREEAILAMARVAYADGRSSHLERDRIYEVAERLGVGRVQVANLLHTAEEERSAGASVHRHSRTTRLLTVTGLLLVGGLAALAIQRANSRVEASERLQAVAVENDHALLFLHVAYEMVRGLDREPMGGTGTGFFISEDGHIVTNKHVVQPWKFLPAAIQLKDAGYVVDPDSIAYSAWPVGARVKGRGSDLVFDDAYCSERGTLELVLTCPDHWVGGNRPLPGGGRHKGKYHALDDHDLAVLRAEVEGPVDFLPLAASNAPIRPLDPIVVLGFPRGLSLIEGRAVVSAPSVGVVRNMEKSILVDAAMYPGNSGGPVLNTAGQVLGVAARRIGGSDGLGRCIRIGHVRELFAEALRLADDSPTSPK